MTIAVDLGLKQQNKQISIGTGWGMITWQIVGNKKSIPACLKNACASYYINIDVILDKVFMRQVLYLDLILIKFHCKSFCPKT